MPACRPTCISDRSRSWPYTLTTIHAPEVCRHIRNLDYIVNDVGAPPLADFCCLSSRSLDCCSGQEWIVLAMGLPLRS